MYSTKNCRQYCTIIVRPKASVVVLCTAVCGGNRCIAPHHCINVAECLELSTSTCLTFPNKRLRTGLTPLRPHWCISFECQTKDCQILTNSSKICFHYLWKVIQLTGCCRVVHENRDWYRTFIRCSKKHIWQFGLVRLRLSLVAEWGTGSALATTNKVACTDVWSSWLKMSCSGSMSYLL